MKQKYNCRKDFEKEINHKSNCCNSAIICNSLGEEFCSNCSKILN